MILDQSQYKIVGIALLVFFLIFSHRNYLKNRSKKIKNFADTNGLQYTEKINLDLSNFELFSKTSFSTISNIVTLNHNGNTLNLMDYVTQSNNALSNRTTLSFVKELNLPDFVLRPGKLIGQAEEKVNLDYFPEFSSKFFLRGSDKAALKKLFSQSLVNHLMSKPKLSIEVNQRNLIIFRNYKYVNPKHYDVFVKETKEILDLFSNFTL